MGSSTLKLSIQFQHYRLKSFSASISARSDVQIERAMKLIILMQARLIERINILCETSEFFEYFCNIDRAVTRAPEHFS